MKGLLTTQWEGAQGDNQGPGKQAGVGDSTKQLPPIGLKEQRG